MSSQTRLTNAYKKAQKISFNNQSKYILFSDCHRSDGSFADDFANNQNIYYHALSHYYDNDFSYIELGDGDELWENISFKNIFEANKNVYLLLRKFHIKSKLHLIFGNHDFVYQNQNSVKKNLFEYFDNNLGGKMPLLPNIVYHEAIVLQHQETQKELFLAHGHQADAGEHHSRPPPQRAASAVLCDASRAPRGGHQELLSPHLHDLVDEVVAARECVQRRSKRSEDVAVEELQRACVAVGTAAREIEIREVQHLRRLERTRGRRAQSRAHMLREVRGRHLRARPRLFAREIAFRQAIGHRARRPRRVLTQRLL